ncbi:MAG: large subunit ribosomal protein [Pseudomonadota bacterium]|nr:large subunit ribosomal protein [Pseudomonadota bacterium]
MRLNTLSPAPGSKKPAVRVGRGIGSGLGKTSGRGHKGQKARSGGYHKINFEGGQMPIQRRLPKMGFKSQTAQFRDELTLAQINQMGFDEISLEILKAHDLIQHKINRLKIIGTGEITKPVVLKGIEVTKSARAAIENAGGRIEN